MPLMRTTTLALTAPIDTQPLDAHFKLVRYDVPAHFRHLARNDTKAYERLHIEIRSQIWQPYRFYTHDQLGPSDHALYVLYRAAEQEQRISLRMLSTTDLPRRVVSFGELEPHMILKLLQAQYFGEDESARFTSQGKHFLLARVGSNRFVGLEIEIRGAKTNNERDGRQEYRVVGRATRFIRVNPADLSSHQLYTRAYVQLLSPKDGQNLLSVVPPDQVRACPNPLFRIHRDLTSRPTLDYHAQRNYKQTRGYLLFTFISAFVDYLAQFGIEADQEHREFSQHRVDPKQTRLHTPEGTVICLLDHRQNQQSVSLTGYLDWLRMAFPGCIFLPIGELSQASRRPTLILQDVAADVFEEGGVLAGEPDPYQELYREPATLGWPKQSICVNPNDAETAGSREEYLTYPLCDFSKSSGFPLRFQVCINQLVLKDLVLNDTPVAERLPFMAPTPTGSASLQSYLFVRRQTYKNVSYPVLLFFQEGRATFLDLRSPGEKERRDALLAELGLDWARDISGPWRAKYRMGKSEEESKAPYHFILGPGQVIEVEDCEEHVLYEYDVIGARQAAVDEPVLIADLKLAPHYDALRTQPMLSLARLTGATSPGATYTERLERVRASAAFYGQLQQIDAFLDELGAHHRRISFNALTSGENASRLEAILFLDGEREGDLDLADLSDTSRVRRRLKRLYQSRGMFLSDKASDVQFYRGIWVDPEHRFMVGSPDQIKFDQARAHLIRRFHAYAGQKLFPTALFLNTLAVLFVRPEQYTVYPYPFHLIDQYVKAKLHWSIDAIAGNAAQPVG